MDDIVTKTEQEVKTTEQPVKVEQKVDGEKAEVKTPELKYSQLDLDNITNKCKQTRDKEWESKLTEITKSKDEELQKLNSEIQRLKDEKVAIRVLPDSILKNFDEDDLNVLLDRAKKLVNDKVTLSDAMKTVSEKFFSSFNKKIGGVNFQNKEPSTKKANGLLESITQKY